MNNLRRKIIKNISLRFRKKITYDNWQIHLFEKNSEDYIKKSTIGEQFKNRTFLADPFIWRDYIYAELFDSEKNNGKLVAIHNETKALIDLELQGFKKYHLSYPQVFEEKGKIYMIPECYQSNGVPIFEAKKLPNKWVFKKFLIQDLQALDTTVLKKDGYYWLFLTVRRDQPNDKLRVFFSDDLFGNYTEVENSPVIVPESSARMGGKFFTKGIKTYRIGQDNSWTYGGGIKFFEVQEMTPERYIEVAVDNICPVKIDNYFDGSHTLNQYGDMLVLDVKRIKFSLEKLFN